MRPLEPQSGSDETQWEIWQTYIVFEIERYMEAMLLNAEIRPDGRKLGGKRKRKEVCEALLKNQEG